MKIYISGKITDLPKEEFERNFQESEDLLNAQGFEAVNPCKIEHNHGQTWEEYMLCDIKALFYCQAIYMLSNWMQSTGAKIEHSIALHMNKIIYYQNPDHQCIFDQARSAIQSPSL